MPKNDVRCVSCRRKATLEEAQAANWTMIQKPSGLHFSMFVLCADCQAKQNAEVKAVVMTEAKPKKAPKRAKGGQK